MGRLTLCASLSHDEDYLDHVNCGAQQVAVSPVVDSEVAPHCTADEKVHMCVDKDDNAVEDHLPVVIDDDDEEDMKYIQRTFEMPRADLFEHFLVVGASPQVCI